MKTLEVSNLCKTYIIKKRQNNVLRNVNLTIHEGEMLGIMGPSGSDKRHGFRNSRESGLFWTGADFSESRRYERCAPE